MSSLSGAEISRLTGRFINAEVAPEALIRRTWEHLFEMPLDVVVTTASGKKTFVIVSKLQTQVLELPVSEDVTHVDIDPENWVLKKIKQKE